jgi:hypothetical protein
MGRYSLTSAPSLILTKTSKAEVSEKKFGAYRVFLPHVETLVEFFTASPPMGLLPIKSAELLLFHVGADNVGAESALYAWGWLLKWGADKKSSRNEIAEEAVQRLMFSFPETSGKPFAAAEVPTVLRRDRFEGGIAQGQAKGKQDSSIYGKDSTQGALQSYIVFNGR